ncbi:MAG: hypothetical protein J6X25_00280 [Bacteroidales bacterium]|nr:hypothetical protein [Bacteroidales bacterium]
MPLTEKVKQLFRRGSLKKYSSAEPTGFMPLEEVHSAVAFIDVVDTSFNECKQALLAFFRENNIKGDIFFFDFRKLDQGERLITSITTTVLKKDLNWFGKPSQEKVNLMLAGEPDLFISLIPNADFPIEFMANCSHARFKTGRVQLPGNVFDLVVKDPADRSLSEAEFFTELYKLLRRIK